MSNDHAAGLFATHRSKWPDFADLSQLLGIWPIPTASEVWFRPEQTPRWTLKSPVYIS